MLRLSDILLSSIQRVRKTFLSDVVITSRGSIEMSLRVDGLVCSTPPYLEAKCCHGLWPTHIIFLSRTVWPRWRSVGLALSGSGTAEYASIKYAACVPPPPPYGHLNEKRQYAANFLSAHLFFFVSSNVALRSISWPRFCAINRIQQNPDYPDT